MRLTAEEAYAVFLAFADDAFVAARSPTVFRFADILATDLFEIHHWAIE